MKKINIDTLGLLNVSRKFFGVWWRIGHLKQWLCVKSVL